VFFKKRLFLNFDFFLLFAVLFLCALGCLNLKSIGSFSHDPSAAYLSKQLFWIFLGLFFLLIIISVDYLKIVRSSFFYHGISLLLLVLVLFFGISKYGSQRWLSVAGFTLQPSEIAKMTFILVLAYFFSEKLIKKSFSLKEIPVPFLLLFITVLPIYLQPDLGTAGMFFIIFFSMFLFLRIKKSFFVFFVSFFVFAIPFVWFFLKEYQKERIRFFINPELDPLNAGYQLIQSKIAIGSGGLLGKGFMQGTQSHLRFLPEQHTDFVFSVWAEEWGFIGCFFLLFIVFFIIYRGLSIAFSCKNFYGSFLALGITFLFFWQVLINVFMTLGLFPVVGVPFPFFSYGGSAMITNFTGVALLLNIGMRKLK
jgi:rod shape determining protein RodA